jgi:hypothetical protein
MTNTHLTRFRNVLWLILRAIPFTFLLIFAIFVQLLIFLGELGEYLRDYLDDLSHSVGFAFRPKLWDALEETINENKQLKSQLDFFKG